MPFKRSPKLSYSPGEKQKENNKKQTANDAKQA
jgi:hypothetical protein